MALDPRIQEALNSPERLQRLRGLVRTLYAQGLDQTRILDLFETTRQELREAGREADEDSLLEVMDFIAGWCSPHMRLGPASPS